MVVCGDEVFGYRLRDVDLLALGKSDDGLFPVSTATEIGSTLALLLSLDLSSVHRTYLLLEEGLDRMLDLNLVRRWSDAKDVLVKLLGKKAGLLRHEDAFDDVVCFFHDVSLGGGFQGPRGRPW